MATPKSVGLNAGSRLARPPVPVSSAVNEYGPVLARSCAAYPDALRGPKYTCTQQVSFGCSVMPGHMVFVQKDPSPLGEISTESTWTASLPVLRSWKFAWLEPLLTDCRPKS